jgi:ABC-type Na+ transport system ATPase subunit NatA
LLKYSQELAGGSILSFAASLFILSADIIIFPDIILYPTVNQTDDWAVRIINWSRLFFTTSGQLLVLFGVKHGSLFGFLGATGAGETTLITMVTSMLPPSDGVIEMFGEDISLKNDPAVLSICSQFNTHRCEELTAYERLRMYSLLYQLFHEDAIGQIDHLIAELEMEDVKKKPRIEC